MANDPKRDTRTAFEREYDSLEAELAETSDPKTRKHVIDAIREMEREAQEQENWQREGFERGWF